MPRSTIGARCRQLGQTEFSGEVRTPAAYPQTLAPGSATRFRAESGHLPAADCTKEPRESPRPTMNSPSSANLAVSVVIPVHNEEAILHAAVVDLRERLGRHSISFEIVLAENGSRDRTRRIAAELAARYPEVRHLSVAEPNYGLALRAGIEDARGRVVICEEIDLCNVDFHLQALALLQTEVDLVIGSKLIQGAEDERPRLRHLASLVYTSVLRALLGFQGTDTHGLKAFTRARLLPLVRACVVDQDVFASELVIRAYRAHLRIREIPIRVLEKRTPSINLLRRVPNVAKNLYRLKRALKQEGE